MTRWARAACCCRRSLRASSGVVAQALGVVEDDDRDDAAVVDERDEGALDVGEDVRARAGAQAELGGEHAIEVERFDGAVAQVDDAVLGKRSTNRVVTPRREGLTPLRHVRRA